MNTIKPTVETKKLVEPRHLIHLHKILVPIDFSENSRKALNYALPYAKRMGADITLLNIAKPSLYEPDGLPEEIHASAKKQLVGVAKDIPPPYTCEIRVGSAYEEICRFAKEHAIDLIIISTHGYTGLKHCLLGSTTEKVVQHAPCPVLAVRRHERDFA
ncbi:MAG: universal stress protein [Verrucomicrobiota bacterium]|nr:universal stress protein [Verrucomicrobiota bacterium]